ncbi:MAG: hypothetical protein V9E89_11680 [Ilumatobacteraceae bacterium]
MAADVVATAAMGYGRQLLMQGRIRNPDAVSALLFDSGAKLVAAEGPIIDELASIATALDEIQHLAEAHFP